MLPLVRHCNQVVVNDKVVRVLHLVNSGTVNYDFMWNMGKSSLVVVQPAAGTVPCGERLVCEQEYCPSHADKLQQYLVSCQVRWFIGTQQQAYVCGYQHWTGYQLVQSNPH